MSSPQIAQIQIPLSQRQGMPPNRRTFAYPFTQIPSQYVNKRYLFFESAFIEGLEGFGNDGAGSTCQDTMVRFNGHPTMRMDVSSSVAGDAGATPTTVNQATHNITKRRIASDITVYGPGKYFFGFWFYFSNIQSGNSFLLAEIYDRNGTNRAQAAVWPNIAGSALSLLNAGPTWPNRHTGFSWDTSTVFGPTWGGTSGGGTGGSGMAGSWNWIEFGIDFDTLKYLYTCVNTQTFAETDNIPAFADTSQKVIHFGFEVGSLNATSAYRSANIGEAYGGIIVP